MIRGLATLAIASLLVGCAGSPSPPPSTVPSASPTRTIIVPRDPTKGQFINATRWAVSVWVDADAAALDRPSPIVLKPGESSALELALGEHRVFARAMAAAESGERLVGRFDRTIAVDAWRPGWFLRFREGDFR
jgi:hypothetical protein